MPLFIQFIAVITDDKFSTMAFHREDDILLPDAAFTHTIDTYILHKFGN